MPAALTEVDTREVSLVDRGAVQRRFAWRKRDAMGDVVAKALKVGLEPEMVTKFEAAVKKLAGSDGAIDPNLKSALKGILQLFVSFRDKLAPEQLAAMAHLVGFTGSQMADLGGSASGVDGAGDDSGDGQGDGSSDGGDSGDGTDGTGSDGSAGDGSADGAAAASGDGSIAGGDPNDPNANKKPPFGKRGTVNPEFQAFKKKADAEVAELRKSQEELRKQNETIRKQLRKRELSEMVRKKYPNLGANEAIADMLLDFDEKGILKSMEPKLAAWNNQMQASELFKESGAPGEGQELSPAAQLDAAAREIMKADPKTRYPAAYTLACEQHPELRKNIHKKSMQDVG